jgi:hypothetical protein
MQHPLTGFSNLEFASRLRDTISKALVNPVTRDYHWLRSANAWHGLSKRFSSGYKSTNKSKSNPMFSGRGTHITYLPFDYSPPHRYVGWLIGSAKYFLPIGMTAGSLSTLSAQYESLSPRHVYPISETLSPLGSAAGILHRSNR